MKDYIIRAAAADNFIRAFAVTSRGVTEAARAAHNLSPVCSAALGRTMAAGLMMGTMMKGEKDILTIQYECDGPIGGITVTAGSNGEVKGYVNNPEIVLPPKADGHFNVGGAVGHGFLHVMKDIGLKEPYAGEVEIASGEIAQDIAYYYAASEQVPSVVALGVLMNHDNTVRESGGYIIQLMPGCPEEIISRLEMKASAEPPVTDLLRSGGTPETILEDILGELDLRILDKTPASFHCNCSRERVTKALIAIGRRELIKMVDDGEPVTLNCHFCNKNYTFSVEELRAILRTSAR